MDRGRGDEPTAPLDDRLSPHYDFLLAYTAADQPWADWIAWSLQEAGLKILNPRWVWDEPGRLDALSDRAVLDSLNADRILVLLSGESRPELDRHHLAAPSWHSDHRGRGWWVVPLRVTDCAIPGYLDGLTTVDLFDDAGDPSGRATAERLVSYLRRVRAGQVRQVHDVYVTTGAPNATFVATAGYLRFRLALRQPGVNIVLAGPPASGRTTALKWAIQTSRTRHDIPVVYSARRRDHLPDIAALPDRGHRGIVAIDDFQHLAPGTQADIVEYLTVLAADDEATGKLVLVGGPETGARILAGIADPGNRIQVCPVGGVDLSTSRSLIEKGEQALGIAFRDREEIARAASGSLVAVQLLCAELCATAGVQETVAVPRTIGGDLPRAVASLARRSQHARYARAVARFCAAVTPAPANVDLLVELGEAGEVGPRALRRHDPRLAGSIARVLAEGSGDLARCVSYLPAERRLAIIDPLFRFYVRHLDREELVALTHGDAPRGRGRAFVCYSHADRRWKDRLLVHLGPLQRAKVLDPWSDQAKLRTGDTWRDEIATALAEARYAVLLIGADFMNSDFIQEVELPALLARADGWPARGSCRILPVLVGPSAAYRRSKLAEIQTVNAMFGNRTLSELSRPDQEKIFAKVADDLMDLIDEAG